MYITDNCKILYLLYVSETKEVFCMKERKSKVRTDFPKDKYTDLMAESLPTLRMRLGINQVELAELIGSSRQMLSLIERKIRPMMWDTFMSIMYVFRSNDATREMMVFMGLYTDELVDFINIDAPEAPDSDKNIAAFGGEDESAAAADRIQQLTREAIERALREIEAKQK